VVCGIKSQSDNLKLMLKSENLIIFDKEKMLLLLVKQKVKTSQIFSHIFCKPSVLWVNLWVKYEMTVISDYAIQIDLIVCLVVTGQM
jgi:hypothetical protein